MSIVYIEKWVISKDNCSTYLNFIPKKVIVRKDEYEDDERVNIECIYINNYKKSKNHERLIRKDWLYDYEEAKIKCKEYKIKIEFKEKMKNKDGNWQCSYCKKIIEEENECTIDHIKPKAYFKNKLTGEYYSEESWKECWDESNLDITCKICNNSKGNLPEFKNNEINEKANKRKRIIRKLNGARMNKPAYNISSKDEDALAIARRDSNYIDVDTFFKKKRKKKKKKKRKKNKK